MANNNSLKFKCQKCGQCCNSEVIISYPDIRQMMLNPNLADRIKKNFKPRSIKGRPIYTTNSIVGVDERNPCVFLKELKCSIYEIRPKICRTYPFSVIPKNSKTSIKTKTICERKASDGNIYCLVLIDMKCPGVGKGDIVDIEHLFDECLEEYFNHKKTYSD
ncbi:MAG: YkgJ family cysteine cluster protein [Candidatus Odinarchaeia archaeon]